MKLVLEQWDKVKLADAAAQLSKAARVVGKKGDALTLAVIDTLWDGMLHLESVQPDLIEKVKDAIRAALEDGA